MKRIFHISKLIFAVLFFFQLSACQTTRSEGDTSKNELPVPKNIIYFIGDGMGYNHVLATNFYLFGEAGRQPYEQAEWTRLGLATYPAVLRVTEEQKHFAAGYNPRLAWEDATYAMRDYTDSGAGGTALSTGVKVYNNSIGIGISGDTLLHISQSAKALGKAAGVVSSVPFSHATPASFAAHNENRRNYEQIARYMILHTRLDLIMGAGHPDFNDNAETEETNARWVGGRDFWNQLRTNDGRVQFEIDGQSFQLADAGGDGLPDAWTVVESREDFLSLASGVPPTRVLGVPKVGATLQQGRNKGEAEVIPFSQPFNENIPSLEEMTRAAINVLSQNPAGFFVMIEGGAIDWASHDGHTGRMIEEQIDFNRAVEAAIEWVDKYSSWDETLIIVTADHECGYLTGPDYPAQVYPDVINRGKGELPDTKWNHDSHTNVLVPFYARGKGQEVFQLMAGESDPVRGPFIQNTQVPQAIFMMWGKPRPEVFRISH